MNAALHIVLIFLLQACAKPGATVFEDNRLSREDEVKLCFTADMGLESEHQKVMAEALENEKCHRIFLLGDLVYPSGIDSADDPQLQSKFLSIYSPLLEKDPNLEIGLVLGNHDHAGDPSAWMDVAKENKGYFFPYYYYMIDYGGLCVVAIDTSFYYYESKVVEAAEQTLWLTRLDSRLKECDVKVALTHHPFKGDGYAKPGEDDWEGASGELKLFLDTYVIGKYDIHMAGHVHLMADDGEDEGTRMLISGAGGEVHGGPERSGYIVLSWRPSNSKRIGYRLQRIDTAVNVFAEPSEQRQEPRKQEDPIEKVIPKTRVEEPWYEPLIKFFRQNPIRP